jgi:hypothetical protein
MSAPAIDVQPPIRGVTRRRLLATGGAAGAAAMVGLRPWAADSAAAASGDGVPNYLIRVTYSVLSSPDFTSSSAGATADLKLIAVTDLQPDLAGSEDAFALRFTSSRPLESGTHTFFHKDLGVFDFLIGPVENRGEYEVVVNRSVNAPKHPPRRRHKREKSIERGSRAAAQARGAHLRRASVRRTARGLVCDLVLEEDVHMKTATVWLMRGDRVVAAVSAKRPHGRRHSVRLPTDHRVRGGRYDLVVITTNRRDTVQQLRVPVVLS